MQKTIQTIGVIDSGFGSLTVVDALIKARLNYNYLVYADNANAPWGSRSIQDVERLSKQAINHLLNQGVDTIIIGCNTTEALVLDRLAQAYSLPCYGLINSTAIYLSTLNKSKRVMILGTHGTIHAKAYPLALRKTGFQGKLFSKELPELVPFIEYGQTKSPAFKNYIKSLTQHMLDLKIDTFILGCSHYPLILNNLMTHLPSTMLAIDPAICLASKLKNKLPTPSLTRPKITIFSSANTDHFEAQSKQYLPHLSLTFNTPKKVTQPA